jgi:hypothetical protein
MACTNCLREMPIAARGLCRACYSRWQKRGTTDYAPKRERHFCHIDGCGKPVVSHGLCDMHRLRLRNHGTLESARPDSWGAKHKHPLFNSWAWMQRHRGKDGLDPRWNDFLQFVTDVGERPSAKHKLFSADDSKPLGPDNFIWKEAVTQRVAGEDEKTYHNRVARVYRSLRVEALKGQDLKKLYGMSLAAYDRLSEEQGHRCAICGQPEEMKIRGKVVKLAVDHCHSKGHVRALLCRACNNGLGMFKDSPDLLEKAAEYLRSH